ncbi:MAG: hypothetical protein QNJ73_03465 [Gammaproteobacteria bacterium]|nr:hypothetical protein [Gammaproteobacteria bacterium]
MRSIPQLPVTGNGATRAVQGIAYGSAAVCTARGMPINSAGDGTPANLAAKNHVVAARDGSRPETDPQLMQLSAHTSEREVDLSLEHGSPFLI